VPLLFAGGIFAFAGGFDSDQHVLAVAIGPDGGHLWHFACPDGAAHWTAQDLTGLVGGAVRIGSTPVGARISDLEDWGQMPASPPAGHSECHVFVVRADGPIVELWSTDGSTWEAEELSGRVPLPLSAVALACYVTDTSSMSRGRIHLVVQTNAGEIWETNYAHSDASWSTPQSLLPNITFGVSASLSPHGCCVTGKTSSATSDDERNRYAMQFPDKVTVFLSTDQLSAACYSWSGFEFIHAPYNAGLDIGHEGGHFMHLPHPFPSWWDKTQTLTQAIAFLDDACAKAGNGLRQLTSAQIASAVLQLDGDAQYGIADTPPDWGYVPLDPKSPVPNPIPAGYAPAQPVASSQYTGPDGKPVSVSVGCANIMDYNNKVPGITKISPRQRDVMLWALQVGNRRRLTSS
jgi:hypothetical protein